MELISGLMALANSPFPAVLLISGVLLIVLSLPASSPFLGRLSPLGRKLAGGIGLSLIVLSISIHLHDHASRPSPGEGLKPLPPDSRDLHGTPRIGRELLVESDWAFLHGEGDTISPFVRLLPDGRIKGIDHPNETTWGLEDGKLVFFHADGRPSTVFESARFNENGKIVLRGNLLLSQEGPVVHVLRQL